MHKDHTCNSVGCLNVINTTNVQNTTAYLGLILCDGKWDCPYGYDETQHNCGSSRLCINKFKCRLSQICIHIYDVCNNLSDCPLQDDEALYQFKNIMCSKMCKCLNFALMCQDVSQDFMNLYNLPYVAYHLTFLSINTISFLKNNKFLMVLNASNNFIVDACQMTSHNSLYVIDLSYNDIGDFQGIVSIT